VSEPKQEDVPGMGLEIGPPKLIDGDGGEEYSCDWSMEASGGQCAILSAGSAMATSGENARDEGKWVSQTTITCESKGVTP